MRDRWITDWDPSERFPYYTRANAGEVLPDPSSPLNTTLIWDESLVPGWREGYVDEIGTHRPEELSEVRAEVIGNFGGYHYINLSATRMIGRRMPGLTVETFDQAWIGDLTDVPPYVDSPGDECPECTEKAGAKMAWALTTTEFPEVEEGKRRADAARANRPDLSRLDDAGLVERARAQIPNLRFCYRYHVPTTTLSTVGPAVLGGHLATLGRPELLGKLISGLGEVDSAAPSFAMWKLSRAARSSPAVSAAFDRGVDSVLDELRASDDPAVAQWLADFDRFEFDYGSRAPNEWDIRSDSWETETRLPLVAIDQMRQADDSLDPQLSLDRNRAEREALVASLVEQLETEEERASFLAAAASVGRFFPWRERTKTNCVKVANEVRVAVFELGHRMVARGIIDDHHDITLLRSDELDAFVADPDSFSDELRRRRVEYDELFDLDPPFVLTSIPPLSEWPRRAHREATLATSGEVLQGVGGSPGRARGIVRVVHDPFDPGGFEPGDILVAPQTDPAWTPLFVTAGAVVVDVGAVITHAVIVSRELGIPCVVSVTDATTRLRPGTEVDVDGEAGTVMVL
jgi:pyruvate,water dikinase